MCAAAELMIGVRPRPADGARPPPKQRTPHPQPLPLSESMVGRCGRSHSASIASHRSPSRWGASPHPRGRRARHRARRVGTPGARCQRAPRGSHTRCGAECILVPFRRRRQAGSRCHRRAWDFDACRPGQSRRSMMPAAAVLRPTTARATPRYRGAQPRPGRSIADRPRAIHSVIVPRARRARVVFSRSRP